MSSYILDTSALLALLNQEPGSDAVAAALALGATIGTVNLAEAVAKLSEAGMPEDAIRAALDPLGLAVAVFDSDLCYRTGMLRPLTKDVGLSLGDRACLALAEALDQPALTADRAWANLKLGIDVQVIR